MKHCVILFVYAINFSKQSKGKNYIGELKKIKMEKIEELTLYVIGLKKEIEALKKTGSK